MSPVLDSSKVANVWRKACMDLPGKFFRMISFSLEWIEGILSKLKTVPVIVIGIFDLHSLSSFSRAGDAGIVRLLLRVLEVVIP